MDRLEAFGKSIPPGTRISRGLDGPPEDQAFPNEPATAGAAAVGTQGQGQGRGEPMQGLEVEGEVEVEVEEGREGKVVTDGDIAQFMDLDRMEEGYVQQFAEGGGHF